MTTDELSEASKQVAALNISLTTLLHKAGVCMDCPPSLSILPIAEQLHLLKLDSVIQSQSSLSTTEWAAKVT